MQTRARIPCRALEHRRRRQFPKKVLCSRDRHFSIEWEINPPGSLWWCDSREGKPIRASHTIWWSVSRAVDVGILKIMITSDASIYKSVEYVRRAQHHINKWITTQRKDWRATLYSHVTWWEMVRWVYKPIGLYAVGHQRHIRNAFDTYQGDAESDFKYACLTRTCIHIQGNSLWLSSFLGV